MFPLKIFAFFVKFYFTIVKNYLTNAKYFGILILYFWKKDMDIAMSGKIGKKWAAIFAACIWAIFALAASVAFRAVTAKAASADDVITIKATSTINSEGGSAGAFTWGTIRRGITLLTTASYDVNGVQGSVTITTIDASTVSIGNVYGSALDERSHEHDFTTKTESSPWESTKNGHYAVCSCGIKLEVAHRPSEGDINTCKDCNITAINEYSFKLPDDTITWDPQYGATINLTIDHIYLFAGFVLKLNMSCAGALQTQNGATISYTVKVSGAGITGETPSNPSGGNGAETIWQLSAASNLSGSDMRTNIDSGNGASITVTLTPSGSGDSSSAYAGTYTDTLTFSVTLEQENV